jgi:hypothetical protein
LSEANRIERGSFPVYNQKGRLSRFTGEGMARFFTLETLAALMGAILVGALGNAAWEYALKPLLPWVSDFILDVATLGVQSYRDQIYLEVAKGNDERAAIAILAAVMAIPISFFLMTFLAVALRKKARPILSMFNKDIDDAIKAGRAPWSIVLTLVAMGITVTFLLVSLVRTIYVVRAANHLEQFQRIVAPYVGADQRLILASRVAQMTTEAQYRQLIAEMTDISVHNHLAIPTFDIR